jgi:xylulokinase
LTLVSGSGVTVGIDIGTTSVKAIAADDDGTVLSRARLVHAIGTPFPGAFEHDIDRAWRANVRGALDEVARGREVAAVNVAAMVPSLGAVRADGRAAGPGLLYGDCRGADRVRDTTRPGDSGEIVAFLAWLGEHCRDATGFWPAQAVANHALCGTGVIDSTTAVTAHPLFDFVGWDPTLTAAAGVDPSALPAVVSGVEPAGRVDEGLAGAGALLGGGTIDALAEQLVAGADRDGDVLVLCGTTLITWGVVGDAGGEAVDGGAAVGLWAVPHTTAGKTLVGGPSNAGGLFLDRARRWVGDVDDGAVASVGPAGLPVWLPYLRGERTPLHRTDIRAALHDLSLQHGPAEVMRAAYEAAGFVVRHHVDLARGVGLGPTRIVASGGGTRVDAWMRALADCTGLPVDVAAVPEGAALGSAFVARCTAGLESRMTDAARWARTSRTIEPDPTWVSAAAGRYERFRELTAAALDEQT